jgi:hypothetical protein
MDNPYASPEVAPGARAGGSIADDLAAYDRDPTVLEPRLARSASIAALFAGAMAVMAGVQTLDVVRLRGFVAAAPWLLIGCGAGSVIGGIGLFRSRGPAALVTTVAAGLLTLVAAGWALFALSHGLIALYSIFTPPAAFVTTLLSAVSIKPVARAARLRRHFEAEGIALR